MVPSLPLLSCESSVAVKENPDRKNKVEGTLQMPLKKVIAAFGSGGIVFYGHPI